MTPDAQADDAATPDGGVAVRVTAISAGADHTCALLSNRTALCWGANDLGQLGDGTRIPRSLPTPVLSADGMSVLDEVDSIAAGAGHTCAVRAGVVWCWGRNDWGQLGNGEEDTDSATPVRVLAFDRVAILAGAIAVRAGDNNTCALMTDTTVQCWGLHIGRCSVSGDCNNDVAGPVSLLGDVRSLEVGTEVGCVATGGGAAWCWGDNAHSAVGDGLSTSYAFRPESVRAARVVGEPMGTAILVDALAVAVGSRHACAARTGRPAVCWGDNRSLQL
ncbi:MAG: hypothetical protein SFX73_10910, partial [Kofleriaceae bacterium]|nr:hypothetical protein [Kofleriaceae bacterium]